MKIRTTDFTFRATWIEALKDIEEREGKEKAQEVAYFIIKLFSAEGLSQLNNLIRDYEDMERRIDKVEDTLENLGV